jgi:uncharacterized repeat protein (TIGR03803 family)
MYGLYGTTLYGGVCPTESCGTVFKITPRKAVEAELPILLVSTLDWILAGNFARIGI